MLAYTISGEGNIGLVVDGKQMYVNASDPQHSKVVEILLKSGSSQDEKKVLILDLLDKKKAVTTYFTHASGIEIRSSGIWFEGEQVHNVVVDRIFNFMERNLPFEPLLNFLSKLMTNPSYTSQQELFFFLEHASLPICEDGDFLAYKAVDKDFRDKHTGKIDNSVGSVVTMPRSRVDDRRSSSCSGGLHAGTIKYVRDYAGLGDKMIIVKINPADVVSVPEDCSNQKLRCCRYEVIREFIREMSFELADSKGLEYADCEGDDCDKSCWDEDSGCGC